MRRRSSHNSALIPPTPPRQRAVPLETSGKAQDTNASVAPTKPRQIHVWVAEGDYQALCALSAHSGEGIGTTVRRLLRDGIRKPGPASPSAEK